MKKNKYDAIIVGSGAGGAPVAAKLAKKGLKVLILEAGNHVNGSDLGKFIPMVFTSAHYSKWAAFNMSKELTTVYRSVNVGGTTVIACANMVRACEKEFGGIGIDLVSHYEEAEKFMNITPVPDKKIIGGTKLIVESARKMGVNMIPMPKGIDPEKKCDVCGNCVLGCHTDYKWDSRSYLAEARMHNAKLITSTKVKRALSHPNGVFYGVETSKGEKFYANMIIISAGALATPVILQNSGVDAGNKLFIDPFNVTSGVIKAKKVTQLKGASMGAVCTDFHDSDGFILSPFMDHWSQFLLWNSPLWNLWHRFPIRRTVSIMTKITDENIGRVYRDGSFSKKLTDQDKCRLAAGASISGEILEAAGAKGIITTKQARGAHPGGSAAIGDVIDENLKVYGAEGLYVCDASIFPFTPGKPPILDITAFGLRLGDYL